VIELIIKNRAAVFTISLLVVILGISAYLSLPRENTPEIKQPWIFVTTVYPGVSPADMESLVTRPLEDAIDGLEGINKITSSSRQSVSSIFVEFDSDTTTEEALRRVKDRVDGARGELPDDAEDPAVKELNSSDWPIFIVVISHPEGVEGIDAPAKALKDELKRIPGVLDASVSGGVTREVAVEVDPLKLNRYGLALGDVSAAIRGENASIPGGTLRNEAGNYSIAVTGEIRDPEDFGRIMVVDGPVKVALADLGSVSLRPAKAESYSRINGKPAISIELKKRTGANLIDLAEEAKKRIAAAQATFPTGTEFVNSYDESKFIKETISDLENNMFSGFVLVLLVTIFFLGFRNALFVSLAIPFSMLISFFVLQAMGITLNMIVLFSLIIALGMLVDNGIVAVENIFRHATMGKTRFRAAVDGIKEIAMPMLSSTLTTCLAFFPIVFMPGIMGDFMSYLPITIIVVLAASFFVAVTINPVFCSLFLGVSERDRKKLVEGSGAFVRVQDLYTRMAGRAVARPWLFIGITTAVVAAGFAAYGIIGKEPVFFPETDPSTAIVNLETRQGTPLDRTDALTRRIEAALPGIETSLEHAQAVVGGNGEDDHKATVRVEFRSYMEREPSGAKSTENLKAALKGFPGAKITFEEIENGPPSGHPVSYEIVGEDYGVLGSIAERIVGILESHPELKGIQSDYEPAKPELAVSVDRAKAAHLGLSTARIAETVRGAFNGANAGSYRDGSEEYDIVVRFQDGQRNTVDQLRGLMLPANEGARVPLASVAEVSVKSSIAVIKRKNHQRSVEIYADFKPDVQNKAEIGGEIGKAVKAIKLPAGYRIETGEGVQVQQESTVFLLRAFVIALFLIAAVLIVQFNSVVDPLIIMSSVFLSLGGIFWGYALTGQVFVVIMTGIGCISLAGVVVNNAIILIDYVNQLIKGGTPWREAIVLSGRTRLRPVILTAITTVLGMIPMALGASFDVHTFAFVVGSEQSEFWQSFAWAMIYGLSFATVMTLVIVPALLSVKFSVLDRIAARKAGKARPAEAGAAQAS
jgi:multidrug efflux pump subunit AcrB